MARAARGAKGRNTALMATLKSVCAFAIWRAGFSEVTERNDVS